MTPEQTTANRIAQLANILQELVEASWANLGGRTPRLAERCDEIYREQIAIATGRAADAGMSLPTRRSPSDG